MNEKSGIERRAANARKRRLHGCLSLIVCLCVCLAAILAALPEVQELVFAGMDRARFPVSGFEVESGEKPAKIGLQTAGAAENTGDFEEMLMLVNKWNALPDDYAATLTELANGQSIDSRIYPFLQAMFDAARAEGLYPVVAAGYRTAEKQQSLMDEKIAAFKAEGFSDSAAKKEAEKWVAIPGKSEHQIGLAVDINADGIHSAGQEVYSWLAKNAYLYGFVLRYPENKVDITGTAYEPWHYRYVGAKAAAEMHEKDLCLEEYLEQVD